MDSLVSAEWLAAHLDDPDLVVVDCRITMTEQGPAPAHGAYSAAHVPGAVFADFINDLSDTTRPIGFAVPTPEAFCETMGRLGVGDNTRVVLYDDRMELPGMTFSSIWAARVWWMLRWVGFDRAALLDGGLGAWSDGGHPPSSAAEVATAATLTPQTRPQLIVDQDEVRAALKNPDIAVVDTLPPTSYDGSSSTYARPGHITGAINLPVLDLYEPDGRFLPDDEIARRHAAVDGRRTITYCDGGIAASATAFALTRIGHRDVAVYTASLQEWAVDPDNPMTTNPAPRDH